MLRSGELSLALLGLALLSISLSFVCLILAKSKNRNPFLAAFLGFLPLANHLAVLYYIGVPKLDENGRSA